MSDRERVGAAFSKQRSDSSSEGQSKSQVREIGQRTKHTRKVRTLKRWLHDAQASQSGQRDETLDQMLRSDAQSLECPVLVISAE